MTKKISSNDAFSGFSLYNLALHFSLSSPSRVSCASRSLNIFEYLCFDLLRAEFLDYLHFWYRARNGELKWGMEAALERLHNPN